MKYFLIFGVISLMAAGCSFNQTATPAQKTTDSQTLTEKCAQQAEVVLADERKGQDLSTTSVTATNHYNSKLNKCLVNVSVVDSTLVLNTVEDAYERKVLLECSSGAQASFCFIPGNASVTGQMVKLTSEQGQAQVRDYMNQ